MSQPNPLNEERYLNALYMTSKLLVMTLDYEILLIIMSSLLPTSVAYCKHNPKINLEPGHLV